MVVARIRAKIATQKDLSRGLKIDSNTLVDVKWLDACFHMNVDKLKLGKLSRFLCPTNTFGKIVAQDKDVLCVATNISQVNGADIIAIPIKWIREVRIVGG